jgi:hypothetical protein
VNGVATFDFRTGGFLSTTAGVIGANAVARSIVPVDKSGNGVTTNAGVAIVNTQSSPVTVRLRLYNETGGEVSNILEPRLNPLGGFGQVALLLTDLFPALPASFNGSLAVEVVGAGSVAVTGLTIKEGLLSAVPATDASVPPSSAKSPEQLQAERLMGRWVFSYTIISTFQDTFILYDVQPSTITAGEWNIFGQDQFNRLVIAGYSKTVPTKNRVGIWIVGFAS